MLRRAIVVLFVLFWVSKLSAGEVIFNDGKNPGKWFCADDEDLAHIKIKGKITKENNNQLKQVLGRNRENWINSAPTVFLDSPGGDMQAALGIAEILRSRGASVIVQDSSQCYSSCFLIYISAVKRWVRGNGELGVHRPRISTQEFAHMDRNKAIRLYNSLLRDVESYMRDHRVPEDIIEDMLQHPSHDIRIISGEEAREKDMTGMIPALEEQHLERMRRESKKQYEEIYEERETTEEGYTVFQEDKVEYLEGCSRKDK